MCQQNMLLLVLFSESFERTSLNYPSKHRKLEFYEKLFRMYTLSKIWKSYDWGVDDSVSIIGGELSLGRNTLVAYMSWEA